MAMKFENVVCTGGAGRLGKYVVDELKSHCHLTVFDMKDAQVSGVQLIRGNTLDFDSVLAALKGQDAVVHLAAIPNPRTAPMQTTFDVNVRGTWTVLEAAEQAGVRRVVVASSDSILGLHYNPVNYYPLYLPIDEQHPVRPTEVYSLSKQITEVICKSYAARGKMEILVIRPTHIVFPPEYPELADRGRDVNNYHLWSYVSPEDMAQSFKLALDLPDGAYDTFTISAASGLNTTPTLELMQARFGRLPEIRKPSYYETNPTASVLDISRAREVLGFVPTSDWQKMAATEVR